MRGIQHNDYTACHASGGRKVAHDSGDEPYKSCLHKSVPIKAWFVLLLLLARQYVPVLIVGCTGLRVAGSP